MTKIYTDYFLDEEDFDKNHFRYKKLSIPDGVEAKPLAVPPVLKQDKLSGNDVWYTIESIESKVQLLPGKATKTWGYNAPLYPGEEKEIEFAVDQPAALTWLHAHPCPSTAAQVWMGLAMGVVVTLLQMTKKQSCQFQRTMVLMSSQ